MASKRYTIMLADGSSGVVRQVSVSARPLVAAGCVLFALPVLMGFGAAWKAKSDVANLEAGYSALEAENASFRSATEQLSPGVSCRPNAYRTQFRA